MENIYEKCRFNYFTHFHLLFSSISVADQEISGGLVTQYYLVVEGHDGHELAEYMNAKFINFVHTFLEKEAKGRKNQRRSGGVQRFNYVGIERLIEQAFVKFQESLSDVKCQNENCSASCILIAKHTLQSCRFTVFSMGRAFAFMVREGGKPQPVTYVHNQKSVRLRY